MDCILSHDDVLTGVTQILKDRQLLYATLHDTENAGKIISYFTSVIYWLAMFVMVLAIFGVNFEK